MPEALVVGFVVAGLTGLLGLGVVWKKFTGVPEARRVEPQPLVVQAADRFVEQETCDKTCRALNARIDAVERRANDDMRLIRDELAILRRGSDNLQRRMNGMSTMVYSIAGKMGLVPQFPQEGEG